MTADPPPDPEWAALPGAEPEVTTSRARRWLVALAVAASAVALAGAVVIWDELRTEAPAAGPPTHEHPAGVYATTEATAQAPGEFAGTPAAQWPSGAAGIALPPAHPTGPFSAEQVAEALELVADALVAARVADPMVEASDPEPFLALLAPQLREHLAGEFTTGQARVYATRLAPETGLAESQPRVRGRVTYREGVDAASVPTLEIITNFVWAYAFAVTGGADPIVVIHDELVWHLPDPSRVGEAASGLWLDRGRAYASNVDCEAYEWGYLRPGPPVPTDRAAEGRDGNARFNPDHPLEVAATC